MIVGWQADSSAQSLRRRSQDAKVESRHGRFAMRKTRCLAFCQRHRVLVGLTLASGLAFAGPGCHQHYHYYNTDPCAPGTPVSSTVRVRAVVRPADFNRRGRNHCGRQLESLDDGQRRTVEVAARRRQQPGQLVAIFLLATLRLGQPGDRPAFKDRSTTRKLIGEWSVVSCQWPVVSCTCARSAGASATCRALADPDGRRRYCQSSGHSRCIRVLAAVSWTD